MRIAITRQVSPAMPECELTHRERQAIDVDLAIRQHHAYQERLAALGCRLLQLPAEPDLPDSIFVEDTAVLLDEAGIITRPGAASRRPETESIARALAPFRALHTITAPGCLDGGDVLRLGKTLYVGLSSRSNQAAIEQLRTFLDPYGYTVRGLELTGCLHLKSAVTQVAANTLLFNPKWIDPAIFPGWQIIAVDPSEPSAANALLLDETVIHPSAYPATRRRMEARGIPAVPVDVSEVIKAEGGVTCCSLIFEQP
ncbi:MAG: dimethylarginine dimethylaminohydrolase family protein [Candidatus Aminicenantales bacterium]